MKTERLTRNHEFLRCYKAKSFVHPLLITYILKTNRPYVRIGFTTSKKIGNAVARNRARRIIKACLPDLRKAKNFDIVFVARLATTKESSTRLAPVVFKHLKDGMVI